MINLTNKAAEKISTLLNEQGKPDYGLRIFIRGGGCSGLAYGLAFEEKENDRDNVLDQNGVKIFVDPQSAMHLNGAEVDFIENMAGGGFKIENPNAVTTCGGCSGH